MEWLGGVVIAAVVGAVVAPLVWLDRRRGPACPQCGRSGTFAPDAADVCANCGLDFRTDDY